jgi:hypothetical protein
MSEQRDLLIRLLIQQCRSIEVSGCEGYRGAYIAKVIGNAADEIGVLRAQLASARKALEEIIDAEKEFREQMGADWEGDPVSDACDRAKLLLTDDTGNSP